MASKSAVPSHLKADGKADDRHHGKTQSHVVCIQSSLCWASLFVRAGNSRAAEQQSREQNRTEQSRTGSSTSQQSSVSKGEPTPRHRMNTLDLGQVNPLIDPPLLEKHHMAHLS